MSIFDLLAEAKIKEWENRDRSTTNQSEEKRKSKSGEYQKTESFEKQLLQDIHGLIEDSNSDDQETNSRCVERAKSLEVQLMASLEKQGLYLTAKRISEELAELRAKD
tara:strand:- start:300 stop:623 length:324 start_codon:yes stop_codon:yes gene_type:complete